MYPSYFIFYPNWGLTKNRTSLQLPKFRIIAG